MSGKTNRRLLCVLAASMAFASTGCITSLARSGLGRPKDLGPYAGVRRHIESAPRMFDKAPDNPAMPLVWAAFTAVDFPLCLLADTGIMLVDSAKWAGEKLGESIPGLTGDNRRPVSSEVE